MPLPAAQLAADSPAPWPGAHPQPTAPPVVRYRSAAGGPARSRQSRPVAGCPPAADGPACGQVSVRSRRPSSQPAVPWPGARALADGKMLAKCVPQRPTVAIYRRHAFPGVRPWQDIAAVRSRAAIRGSFFTSCVPEGASDGKSASSRQHIAAMHPKRAGFGKICAPCIRKAPQIAVGGYTTRRSCQEGALFAARAPQIMHGTQILPSFGARRVLGLMRERLGAGLRKRTPYCCRRSRVPARHLVAFCGGSLSRSKRLVLRHAALAVTIPRRDRPALFRSAAASHDLAHKKRPAFCWPFLRGYELSADYSARSFRRRSSSSASWWRLTLPDSVIGMASMNSMCSGRRRLATPMESRYSAMESSVGSTSPV